MGGKLACSKPTCKYELLFLGPDAGMASQSTARAFWVMRPGHGEIRTVELRPPESGEARVRTLYSAISRGTESLVFDGLIPDSEYARMRAPFQGGDFPAPVKYGYINVGVVEAGPAELLDRPVFCLFPHQTNYNAPVAALYPLPGGVPPHRAVLAANLETALNSLWDAAIKPRSRLTVIGAGAVGSLCAWLAAKLYAADVELVDIDESRAPIASALGARFARPETASLGATKIIHSSGSGSGLATALGIAGFEALIVEVSWYGNKPVSISLGQSFHSQRLTIRASQVGHVATSHRGHFTLRSRMEYCLRLLADPVLDMLIDAEDRFEDLPTVMQEHAAGKRRSICHRITYDN